MKDQRTDVHETKKDKSYPTSACSGDGVHQILPDLSESTDGLTNKMQQSLGSAETGSVSSRNIPPLLHELIKPSLVLFLSLSLPLVIILQCCMQRTPLAVADENVPALSSLTACLQSALLSLCFSLALSLCTHSLINSAISNCFS